MHPPLIPRLALAMSLALVAFAPSPATAQTTCEARGAVPLRADIREALCVLASRVTGGLHGGNTGMGIWLVPEAANIVAREDLQAEEIVRGFLALWRDMNPDGVRVEVYTQSGIHLATASIGFTGRVNVRWRR